MSTSATKALQLAQQIVDSLAASDIDNQGIEIEGQIHSADEIRSVIRRGLESLRQGPLMLHAIDVDRNLREASKKAGSDAALASAMGVSRQYLHDVMSGRKPPGPLVLAHLKLRIVANGRTLYTPIEADGIKPKAPRSERRQKAWDGPSGISQPRDFSKKIMSKLERHCRRGRIGTCRCRTGQNLRNKVWAFPSDFEGWFLASTGRISGSSTGSFNPWHDARQSLSDQRIVSLLTLISDIPRCCRTARARGTPPMRWTGA